MKKITRRMLALFLTLVLVMTTLTSLPAYAKGSSPSLNKKSVKLTAGKSTTLKVKKAGGKKIVWSSSNPSVATVSGSGKVTGVKKGSAKITANVGGKKLTCKVKVNGAKIKKTLLNATTVTLVKGSSFTLKAVASPIGAENKGFKYKSSKKKIASVSGKGVIKAKKAGKTTITVTSKTGNKKAKCTVVVVNAGSSSNNSRSQAVTVAREYMKAGKQTYSGLVAALKKDGFTAADAEAAAKTVGLKPAGTAPANKIIYSISMSYDAQYMVKGRKADRSILSVTAKYSDGSTKVLSASEYALSEGVADNGMYFITVSAGGASASKYLTILDEDPQAQLVSLTNAQYRGTQPVPFADIAKLNVTKFTVDARYSDGSVKTVQPQGMSTGNVSSADTSVTVTLSYGGKSTTVTLSVTPESQGDPTANVQSISNAKYKGTQPVAYSDVSGFQLSMFTVDAKYTDGTTKTVTPESLSTGTVSSADTSVTVTLAFGGKTTTVTLSMTPESQGDPTANLQSISNGRFTGTQPVAFADIANLDMSMFTVDAHYTDGTTKTVTPQGMSVGSTSSSATSATVTLTFGGKTTTVTISVTPGTQGDPAANLQSISNGRFTGTQPVAYADIANLKANMFTVDALYSDGTTKTVTPQGMSVGSVSSTATSATVTLTLGGKTTTVTISVTPQGQGGTTAELQSISNPQFKGSQPVAYSEVSNLDMSMFTVDARYSDGTVKTVTPMQMTVKTVQSSDTTATVILGYMDKSVTITLSVSPEGSGDPAAGLQSIENAKFKGSQPVAFDDISTLDIPMFTVDARYSDGTVKTVQPQGMSVGSVSSTATSATVTLTYGGKSTTVTLLVTPKGGSTAELLSLSNAGYKGTQPVPYANLSSLSASMFTVDANYSDGSTETVTPQGMSLKSVTSTSTTATVTLTYGGKTTSITLTVTPEGQSQGGDPTAELTGIENPKFTGSQPIAFDDIANLNVPMFTVDARYSDGTVKTVTPQGLSTGSVSSTATSVEVTLMYKDKSTKITLSVTPKTSGGQTGTAGILWSGLPTTMKAGQTGSYPATVTSSGAGSYTWSVAYSSSDPTVLSIDRDGNVSAQKAGTAILTAKLLRDGVVMTGSDGREVTASAQVTVNPDNGKVASVTLEYVGNYTVIPNDYDILTDMANWKVTEKYANGTAISETSPDFENCAVEISAVDLDAETMTVRAYIVSQPGILAEVTMPYEVKYETQPGTETQRGFRWDSGTKTMLTGDTLENPATNVVGVVIRYASSDEDVATVTQDGTITAVAEGTALITATPYKEEAPTQFAEGLSAASATVKVLPKPTGAVARYTGGTAPMSGFSLSMSDVEVKYICGGVERSISDYPGTSVSVGSGSDTGAVYTYKVTVSGKFGTFTTSLGIPHLTVTALDATFNNGQAMDVETFAAETSEQTKARYRVTASFSDGTTRDLSTSEFSVQFPAQGEWNYEGSNETVVSCGKGDYKVEKTVIIVLTGKKAAGRPEDDIEDNIEDAFETGTQVPAEAQADMQGLIEDPGAGGTGETAEPAAEPAEVPEFEEDGEIVEIDDIEEEIVEDTEAGA